MQQVWWKQLPFFLEISLEVTTEQTVYYLISIPHSQRLEGKSVKKVH